MLNIKIIIAVLIIFINIEGLLSQEEKSGHILFIGNSYTYFWNLPQQVAVMAESRNIELTTVQSTIGGVNLGQHWKSERNLHSRSLLEENNFQAVILQDHSTRAIENPDSLRIYMEHWIEEIKNKKGKVFLYMTWARKWDPYMIQSISTAYLNIGQKTDVVVVPVGWAWDRARRLRPDLELYDSDGSHPSPIGTYLTACVFFGVLTGENPIGLPDRLVSKDHSGEKLYLNILSPGDALFCQKVANEILQINDYNSLTIE